MRVQSTNKTHIDNFMTRTIYIRTEKFAKNWKILLPKLKNYAQMQFQA